MAFKKNLKPMDPEKALLRLEELCARSEHCEYELRQKLYRWNVPVSDADIVINSLKHRRFIDDERFARAYVRDKVQFDRWGRRKISLALSSKRIDREIIDTVLSEIDPAEYEQNLKDLLMAKARNIDDCHSYQGRTKLFRFAAARGYEPELVALLIRQLFV